VTIEDKFIQLTAVPMGDDALVMFALDDGGDIWQYHNDAGVWESLPTERQEIVYTNEEYGDA